MSLHVPDIRVQLNQNVIQYLDEIDSHVSGYELIAENVIATPHRYEKLPLEKPISLHSIGIFPTYTWPSKIKVFKTVESFLYPRKIDLLSIHLAKDTLGDLPADRLIPLPCSRKTIVEISNNIKMIQDGLGKNVLIENISEYYSDPESDMNISEFVFELIRKSGCLLLLDLNNYLVNLKNFPDSKNDIETLLHLQVVRELHMAGHSEIDGISIDSHGEDISAECLSLLQLVSSNMEENVTIVLERDSNIASSRVLIDEIERIKRAATFNLA